MPRTARVYSQSGYYHVINRGVGQQILFEDNADYSYFLQLLNRNAREENVEIIAYCLMNNHIHLLLHAESGPDKIMHRISTSYATYFNAKYTRPGHLFQGRYKSEPLESERALLAVVRYIHNNPSAARICSKERYAWSSWHAYTGTPGFVSTELVLQLTGGIENFLRLSESDEKVDCLDFHNSKRLNDEDAERIVRNILHLESGTMVQSMDRKQRNSSLRLLKEQGLSVRQIQRLTGISQGVITRA